MDALSGSIDINREVLKMLAEDSSAVSPDTTLTGRSARTGAVIEVHHVSSRSKTLVWVGEPRSLEVKTVYTSDFGIPAAGICPRRIT